LNKSTCFDQWILHHHVSALAFENIQPININNKIRIQKMMAQQLLLDRNRLSHLKIMDHSCMHHLPIREAVIPMGKTQQLSGHIRLKCFFCKNNDASHTYMLDWDGLDFQLCLCPECILLGKNHLIAKLLEDHF